MSESWMKALHLTLDSFPIEILGYPEGSPADAEPIFRAVLDSPDQTGTPPLPKQRMRMKIVAADGSVVVGEER